MKVAFLSSEAAPFSKTGGLADVSGALPRFLNRAGEEVFVFTPLYREVRAKKSLIGPVVEVKPGPGFPRGFQVHASRGGEPVYFIAEDSYFDREYIYGPPAGAYQDNGERYAFFCRASLKAMKELGFRPDIIHGNDWQSAPAFAYLKYPSAPDDFFAWTGTVFTIHNLAYQGTFEKDILSRIGLPEHLFNMNDLEFYGKVNFMKAGILYSSIVTTVSRQYAREIQTPEFGCGLDGLLRSRSKTLFGVLNGVDYEEWDPMTDKSLPKTFGPADPSGKAAAREALLQAFGLSVPEDRPIAGMVTRLASQKGLDLVCEALDRILQMGITPIILGTGEARIQDFLKESASRHSGKLGLRMAFDEKLARLIYAGSDMFIIPSRYEPCGLTQMYSLKYGTIPVVRATGGLEDTITDFNQATGRGNGFKFQTADAPSLIGAMNRAATVFKDGASWRKLMQNAMASDFSWDKSAAEYIRLYRKLSSASSR